MQEPLEPVVVDEVMLARNSRIGQQVSDRGVMLVNCAVPPGDRLIRLATSGVELPNFMWLRNPQRLYNL